MSYKIDWQSNDAEGIPGKAPITLPNKTLNSTSTSLTLTGKGINNYGEIQQENFLRLMENFSSAIPPPNPTIGQIWFNTAETILYMRVDPAVVGPFHPLYHPQSPAAWVQIWPDNGGANTYAGLNEYNAIGIDINRIIGVPSLFGSDPDTAYEQWGWGQSDLVPIYTNANLLAPGFDPLVYPPVFDNNAWVILLSRLRKALRHIGVPESQASPVGFINDNRPFPPGNLLANNYNDNPASGTLEDYKSGWQNLGLSTVSAYYANTISAVNGLKANRFIAAPISTEMQTLGSVNRSTPWTSSVSQNVSMTFLTYDIARSYFNSGGTFTFNFALNSPGADLISTHWYNFLIDQSNLIFDFKGIRHGAVYHNAPSTSTSLGFYDLTSTPQLIYQIRRNYTGGAYGAYDAIYDSGLQIFAHEIYNLDGTCTVNFNIVFVEAPHAGESVTGTLVSSQVAKKANSINVNSPMIAYPSWTGSAITDVVPVPPTGPAES
jgi:hypothetical protein